MAVAVAVAVWRAEVRVVGEEWLHALLEEVVADDVQLLPLRGCHALLLLLLFTEHDI